MRLRLQRRLIGVWLVASFLALLREALKLKSMLQYRFRAQALGWVPLEEGIAWCEQHHQILSVLEVLQVESCCPW